MLPGPKLQEMTLHFGISSPEINWGPSVFVYKGSYWTVDDSILSFSSLDIRWGFLEALSITEQYKENQIHITL